MISPNELRLGNFLNCNVRGYTISGGYVTKIQEDCFYLNTIRVPDYRMAAGIELTEEWLVKLGTKRTIKNNDSGYFQYELTVNGFDIMFCLELNKAAEVYLNGIRIKVSCVHHYQNLFFDLTGQELTINTNYEKLRIHK